MKNKALTEADRQALRVLDSVASAHKKDILFTSDVIDALWFGVSCLAARNRKERHR